MKCTKISFSFPADFERCRTRRQVHTESRSRLTSRTLLHGGCRKWGSTKLSDASTRVSSSKTNPDGITCRSTIIVIYKNKLIKLRRCLVVPYLSRTRLVTSIDFWCSFPFCAEDFEGVSVKWDPRQMSSAENSSSSCFLIVDNSDCGENNIRALPNK